MNNAPVKTKKPIPKPKPIPLNTRPTHQIIVTCKSPPTGPASRIGRCVCVRHATSAIQCHGSQQLQTHEHSTMNNRPHTLPVRPEHKPGPAFHGSSFGDRHTLTRCIPGTACAACPRTDLWAGSSHRLAPRSLPGSQMRRHRRARARRAAGCRLPAVGASGGRRLRHMVRRAVMARRVPARAAPAAAPRAPSNPQPSHTHPHLHLQAQVLFTGTAVFCHL